MKCPPALLSGALAVSLLPYISLAATITYQATDLADTTPGQDRWLYSYAPGDFAFALDQGFTIFFDRTLYSLLQGPPPVVPNWDIISVQRDFGLDSDGFYDALALQNAPSLALPFTVEFVWLGTGRPGSQPFTMYDADFSTMAQGQTTPVALSLQIIPPFPGINTFQLVWSPSSAILEGSGDLIHWTIVTGVASPLVLSPNDPAGSRFYRLRRAP